MLIDTHQHLIFPEKLRYPWAEGFPQLLRKHGIEEYRRDCGSASVDKTLFMEVDVPEVLQLAEVQLVAGLAAEPENRIAGILASGRPEHEGFLDHLDTLMEYPVKGIRRVLHVMPDETSTQQRFRENIRELGKRGLTFDIVVRSDQLSYAIDLVDACPEVSFVLDHCGNPAIGEGEWESWAQPLNRLSERSHVACKLSGLAVNCGEKPVTRELLEPYLTECLEYFGARRVLFGGDWPVCQLATTLGQWIQIFQDWMASNLSKEEQHAASAGNAERIYNL